jgi:cytochrome c-type biogenesis protein CcmH/NrfF
VVGLAQFADGVAGSRRRWQPRSRARAWLLSALPVVIVVIWVVARVARHL